ncbi:hypothetical protein CCAX7_005130 [Capsulimonas corticalis]|uniref:Uncharacterized protein n=1 Tax=Capsulimonas corticalis TaxID=2219043 RepID=A0A402D2M4_9BACT|nr:hypothetical protein [Capsulimonas corticalis]BDI28462.1 hypothetical protein CCAX7_005130 [Capsulimonas corticalis]
MLQENTAPTGPPLITLHATAANGFQYGAPFSVPEGWVGLITLKNEATDCVGAGQYVADAATLPQLALKARLKPGEQPRKPLALSLYLMPWGAPANISWKADPIAVSAGAHLTYQLSGRSSVRVAHPVVYFNTMQSNLREFMKKLTKESKAMVAGMPIAAQTNQYLKLSISYALENTPALSPAAYSGNPAMRDSVRNSASLAVSQWLAGAGVECLTFDLDSVSDVLPAPCVECKATHKPVAYSIFRRTISLLYVRYGVEKKGNFCLPCAAKVSLFYNVVMLICGWWGYIGLVLAPVYIITNCYHFLKNALGPKAQPPVPVAPAGAWPPPPSV